MLSLCLISLKYFLLLLEKYEESLYNRKSINMLFYRSIIMLDLRFVRENPEIVKQNIRNKFQDSKLPLVDEVIELDKQNRATKQEADSLRAERYSLPTRPFSTSTRQS